MTMQPQHPPAGWYPDERGAMRWWDGARWTEHVNVPPVPQVVYAGPYSAVTRQQKRTSHTFHLVMTLLTFGAWGVVWLAMTLWHELGPRAKSRTRYR